MVLYSLYSLALVFKGINALPFYEFKSKLYNFTEFGFYLEIFLKLDMLSIFEKLSIFFTFIVLCCLMKGPEFV